MSKALISYLYCGDTMTTVGLTRQLFVRSSVFTEFNENLPSLFVECRSRGRKDERGFSLEHSFLCEEYMTIQNNFTCRRTTIEYFPSINPL